MAVKIVRIDPDDSDALRQYTSVPMRLTVESLLEVSDVAGDWPGFTLHERPVSFPWSKDYASDPEGDPVHFLRRFICAHNTALFLALDNGRPIGGAAGIRHCFDARYFCMTDGRDDMAVLADIRVTPGEQRGGVGSKLFRSTVEWARAEGMKLLKIETQNTNVPACHFYRRMGAKLGGMQRHAYSGEHEDEAMLLWYLEL
jgi:streptothricin acetyltransferase